MLMAWWEGHGLKPLGKIIFPNGGAVAYAGNRPVAMAFLYLDRDGRLGMIEWTSTNPARDIPGRDKLCGVKALWAHLEMEARLMGCKCMLSMVRPGSSEERMMTRLGWVGSGDQEIPHVMYAKQLN